MIFTIVSHPPSHPLCMRKWSDDEVVLDMGWRFEREHFLFQISLI